MRRVAVDASRGQSPQDVRRWLKDILEGVMKRAAALLLTVLLFLPFDTATAGDAKVSKAACAAAALSPTTVARTAARAPEWEHPDDDIACMLAGSAVAIAYL